MQRRIVAIVLLIFFLIGLALLFASFILGRNELALTGLGLAVPVGVAVLIFKVMRRDDDKDGGPDDEK